MRKDNIAKGAQPEAYLTPAEVARLCNVSTKSVYRWVELGAVPVYRAGKQLRFRRAEVEAYLARDARQPAELTRALWP